MLDLALQKTRRNRTMEKNKNLNQLNGWPYLVDLAGKHRKVNMDHVLYVESKNIVLDGAFESDQNEELIKTLNDLGFTGFYNNRLYTFDKTLNVEILSFNLDNNEVIDIFSSATADRES